MIRTINVFISVLLAACFILSSFTTSYAGNSTFIGNTHSNPVFMKLQPKKATTPEQLKCMRHVLMTVGEQTYEVSRWKTLHYTTAEGRFVTDKDEDHPANDCEIVDVGPVRSFSTGYNKGNDIDIRIEQINPKSPNLFVTTYALSKSVIDDMQKSLMYKTLHDGTRRFTWDRVVIFMLPKKILKTANREPVIVYCTINPKDDETSLCNAKYYHPDGGIAFGYSYIERKGIESDHFGLDILARKKFKEMKHVKVAQTPESTAPASSQPAVQPEAKPADNTPPAQ